MSFVIWSFSLVAVAHVETVANHPGCGPLCRLGGHNFLVFYLTNIINQMLAKPAFILLYVVSVNPLVSMTPWCFFFFSPQPLHIKQVLYSSHFLRLALICGHVQLSIRFVGVIVQHDLWKLGTTWIGLWGEKTGHCTVYISRRFNL